MKKNLLKVAVISLLLIMFSGKALAIDVSTLWPKILKILEKVEELEEQNKTIIQNQERILEELRQLRGTYQSGQEPGSKKK